MRSEQPSRNENASQPPIAGDGRRPRPCPAREPHPETPAAPVPAASPAPAEYLARWLTDIEPALEPATCAYYQTMARLHIIPVLGGIRIDRLGARDVQAWLRDLAAVCQCCAQGKDAVRQRCCAADACCQDYTGRRTVQGARNTLRAALNHARASGELVSGNAVARAEVSTPPRRERATWSTGEATRFLSSARDDGDPFYAAYVLMLVNGLSKGEVLGLTWPSAGLDGGELDFSWQLQRAGQQFLRAQRPTTGDCGAGTLPMPPICVSALRQRQGEQAAARQQAGGRWTPGDLVFTPRWGTPVEPRNFNRSFSARCATAGVTRIRVHDTRRTCGPLLAALGISPEMALPILRHAMTAPAMPVSAEVLNDSTQAAMEKRREPRRSAARPAGPAMNARKDPAAQPPASRWMPPSPLHRQPARQRSRRREPKTPPQSRTRQRTQRHGRRAGGAPR